MWKIGVSLALSLAFAVALHLQPLPTITNEETQYIPAEFAVNKEVEVIDGNETGFTFGDGAHKRFKTATEGKLTREN
ncbi:MAG: hypothetical protein Q7S79_01150 [bacterium]|nr:hypothetical protein [bacterium]